MVGMHGTSPELQFWAPLTNPVEQGGNREYGEHKYEVIMLQQWGCGGGAMAGDD